MQLKPFVLISFLITPIAAFSDFKPYAELQTNFGTIAVRLNHEKAPVSSQNFYDYAAAGFYENTLFHRVVKYDFDPEKNPKGNQFSIIQGGGADIDLRGFKKPNAAITNESGNGLSNKEATIAMARSAAADSATSQFYINTRDNSGVFDKSSAGDGIGYAVFGEVVEGFELAQAFDKVDTSIGIPLTPNYTPLFVQKVYLSDTLDTTKAVVRITTSDNELGKVSATAPTTSFGKVNSKPGGIKNCGALGNKTVCTTTRPRGTEAAPSAFKLTASPAKNYVFTGWRGDCFVFGYKNPVVINLTKNYNCTATFGRK